MDCAAIKKAIIPKTLNKFTFARVIIWIVVGVTLCIVWVELESSESMYDIQCVTGNNPHNDSIHRLCYHEYRMRNGKLGISSFVFVMVNMLVIPIVRVSYSHYAKSTVNELERNPQDAQGQLRDRRRNLFIAYLAQLILSIFF